MSSKPSDCEEVRGSLLTFKAFSAATRGLRLSARATRLWFICLCKRHQMTNSAETSRCWGFKSDANVNFIFHSLLPHVRRRTLQSPAPPSPVRLCTSDEVNWQRCKFRPTAEGPLGACRGIGGVTKWHQSVTSVHCCRQGDDEHLSFWKGRRLDLFSPFWTLETRNGDAEGRGASGGQNSTWLYIPGTPFMLRLKIHWTYWERVALRLPNKKQ